jgi:hypothetical protein
VVKYTDGNWDALRKERVERREGEVSRKPRADAEMAEGLNLNGRIGSVADLEDFAEIVIVVFDRVWFEKLAQHSARRTEASARGITIVVSLGEIRYV